MQFSATKSSKLQQPSTEAIEINSRPYMARWNHLVSRTNWEKGRIICQWRAALVAAGAPASEYSDEAWSRRVGGISPQHVGRLRRVFERFGQVNENYPGLYWSHFCAALDWDDAEMWLEGAVQNRWSVAQMRAQRSEVLGLHVGEQGESPAAADQQEPTDESPSEQALPLDQHEEQVVAQTSAAIIEALQEMACAQEAEQSSSPEPRKTTATSSVPDHTETTEAPDSHAATETSAGTPQLARLAELPEDLQEAFEQLKLVILRHKLGGWQSADPGAVAEVLEGLKALLN